MYKFNFKKSKKGKFIVTIYFSISDTGITQAPAVPVQQTYIFNLKYKATVDCYNVEIRNQIKANNFFFHLNALSNSAIYQRSVIAWHL